MNSVEELSIIALGQRLKKVFGLREQPIECPNNDRVHLLQTLSSRKGEKLEYPLVTYSLTGLNPGETANPSVAMLMGHRTSVLKDTIGSLRMIPVHLVFDVFYADNDRSRVISFMSSWVRAGASGLLNFSIRVDGMPISIQVLPDTSLSSPQKDISPDNANQYEFQSTISMRTYVSGPFETAVRRITTIREVVSGFYITPNEVDLTANIEVIEASLEQYSQADIRSLLAFEVLTRVD